MDGIWFRQRARGITVYLTQRSEAVPRSQPLIILDITAFTSLYRTLLSTHTSAVIAANSALYPFSSPFSWLAQTNNDQRNDDQHQRPLECHVRLTQQKISCFQRDQAALAACLDAIVAQCDDIDSACPSAEALRLKIKAHCPHELRLANESAILRPASGAIAFLKLGEADRLLKEDVLARDAHLEEMLICLRRRIQHGIVFAAILQERLLEKHTVASIKEVMGPSIVSHAPPSSSSIFPTSPTADSAPPSKSFIAIDFLKSQRQ